MFHVSMGEPWPAIHRNHWGPRDIVTFSVVSEINVGCVDYSSRDGMRYTRAGAGAPQDRCDRKAPEYALRMH